MKPNKTVFFCVGLLVAITALLLFFAPKRADHADKHKDWFNSYKGYKKLP